MLSGRGRDRPGYVVVPVGGGVTEAKDERGGGVREIVP